jgi:hypothetical protein
MIVKYPVHTWTQDEAIKIAKATALTHGFKRSMTMQVEQLADTSWVITLDVTK